MGFVPNRRCLHVVKMKIANIKLNEILNSPQVRRVIHQLFKKQAVEVIKRHASSILKLKHEPEERVFRIILLPPHGYTSNKQDETSPHPEVRRAKIEIKGGIRPEKSGFSILKNILKYQYYSKKDIKIDNNLPYPKIGKQHYRELIKSAKETFFVVRENGSGFYHNLINVSNEWIMLVLDKELRLQKTPDVESVVRELSRNEQKIFLTLYKHILRHGDEIFNKNKGLINKVSNFDVDKAIPPLVEMLNVIETGKHEPCSVFGIILKIGKKNRRQVNKCLKEAVLKKAAPTYYLRELQKKLI